MCVYLRQRRDSSLQLKYAVKIEHECTKCAHASLSLSSSLLLDGHERVIMTIIIIITSLHIKKGAEPAGESESEEVASRQAGRDERR